MQVVVALENVYVRTPDSRIWTQAMFGTAFFSRYLRIFERVTIAARVQDVPSVASDWQSMEHPNIGFSALPYYHGPMGYLLCLWEMKRATHKAVDPKAALILRVASHIAGVMASQIRRTQHPFAVEVVCDPWDIFGPRGIRHPLRPYLRWHFTKQLRRQCAEACAASYVTEQALQTRYPTAEDVFSVSISSVELPPAAFADHPRDGTLREPGVFRLLLVGGFAQRYKGHDLLLKAAQRCLAAGIRLEITMIGDGCLRKDIERLASELSIIERCRFLGQLTAGVAVRSELDRADLFVLPSRTEGLPRALLEAMARGLPCIGSNVGGIPELLPASCLIPPEDPFALEKAITAMAHDEQRRKEESARNLARARNFSDHLLDSRRLQFYTTVRDKTASWLKSQP